MKKLLIGLLALEATSVFAQENSYYPTYKNLKSITEIALDSKFDQCMGQLTSSNLKLFGELVLGKRKANSPNLDYFIVPVSVSSRESTEIADTLNRLEDYGICPKSLNP